MGSKLKIIEGIESGSSVPARPWGIGGSDIGAILGLSPYRGPVDVWAEKVGGDGGGAEAIHLLDVNYPDRSATTILAGGSGE